MTALVIALGLLGQLALWVVGAGIARWLVDPVILRLSQWLEMRRRLPVARALRAPNWSGASCAAHGCTEWWSIGLQAGDPRRLLEVEHSIGCVGRQPR